MRFVLEHYQPEFVTNVDVLSYAGNPENLADVAEEHADRYEFFQTDIADREAIEAILSQHKFYRSRILPPNRTSTAALRIRGTSFTRTSSAPRSSWKRRASMA